jgi:hypothetical protein
MNTWLPTTRQLDQVWGGGVGTCGLSIRFFAVILASSQLSLFGPKCMAKQARRTHIGGRAFPSAPLGVVHLED